MQNEGYKSFDEGYTTEIFSDAAIDFFKRHQEDPFFVTLSYNSVHHLIHQVPKTYLDKFGVKEIPDYDPFINLRTTNPENKKAVIPYLGYYQGEVIYSNVIWKTLHGISTPSFAKLSILGVL